MEDRSEMAEDSDAPTEGRRSGGGKKSRLGSVASREHQDFVSRVQERFTFYLGQLQDPWMRMVRWSRLYLADRDDSRAEDEKWRAQVFVPEPTAQVDSWVANMHDILLSADPPVQPEGVGEEDYEPARKIQSLIEVTLRRNRFRGRLLPSTLRMSAIQGLEWLKVRWEERVQKVSTFTDKAAWQDFQAQLADGLTKLNITDPTGFHDYTTDPEAFGVWREMVNSSQQARIPELPTQVKDTVVYRGPVFDRIPMSEMFFDPLIENIQRQTLVLHRMVVSQSWVKKQVKEGVFDAEAVEFCNGSKGALKDLLDTDRQINDILGYPSSSEDDPYYRGAAEIWEVFQPDHEYAKYTVIMNRRGVVNKTIDRLPHTSGLLPFVPVRMRVFPGRLPGLSLLQAPESLFYELNSLRGLRLDRTTLETLPVFKKLRQAGMPEMRRKLVPGGMVDVDRMEALEQLISFSQTNAFQDLHQIGQDIANASGVNDPVKGAAATVGRVSASEANGRMTQALARIKTDALGVEEDLSALIPLALHLYHQKGDQELRVKITGSPDPLAVSKQELVEALEMDYRFRGATNVLDKAMQVQQMDGLVKSNVDILTQPERREVLKLAFESLGLKGLDRVFTETGDKLYQTTYELQSFQAESQLQDLKNAKMAAQVQVPGSVPPEMAQMLEAQGGGAAPPPESPSTPAAEGQAPA